MSRDNFAGLPISNYSFPDISRYWESYKHPLMDYLKNDSFKRSEDD